MQNIDITPVALNINLNHNLSLLSLFAACVEKEPLKIAVIDPEGKQINYKQLDVYSNQIAARMYQLGLPENKRIGICVARSTETVATMLATLKLGCTYIPLAPDYPTSRMHEICHQAQLNFIVANNGALPKLPQTCTIIDIDQEGKAIQFLDGYYKADGYGTEPAIIIFTSGTTNLPRGVLISEKNIVNLVTNQNYVEITPNDVFLQLSPFEFDGSTFEIWGALLNGATIVLMPTGYPTLSNIVDRINKYKISILFITTQLFNIMVDNRLSELDKIPKILFGGEIASKKHVIKFFDSRKYNQYIANIYGPTECTTFSTFYPINTKEDILDLESIPIGKTIKGVKICLDYSICEEGDTAAELLIGGDGLSIGYLGIPELTKEKFIKNDGLKFYKTGDKVKLNSNNDLIFIGRFDDQVKVRGHRFLPSEIEALAQNHFNVTHAALTVENAINDDKYLTLFVVSNTAYFNIQEFKAYLNNNFPSYMRVNKVILLNEIPLKINGKVDYKKLKTIQKVNGVPR